MQQITRLAVLLPFCYTAGVSLHCSDHLHEGKTAALMLNMLDKQCMHVLPAGEDIIRVMCKLLRLCAPGSPHTVTAVSCADKFKSSKQLGAGSSQVSANGSANGYANGHLDALLEGRKDQVRS